MAKSEQILNKLLIQIAKEQDFVNYDLKVEPISSGGANYTSTLHNITISEGDKVVHMFAKVAAVGEAMRAQAPKFFITENFAYTKLLKIYDQLQDEHQVPQEHRLVFSKFYGSIDEVYEETIVLENLVKEGYLAYDRFKTIEWEYAQAALRELAKMHALAIAYSEYRSEEFNGVLEILKFEFDIEGEMMAAYFDKVIARAIDIIRADNKELVQRYFEKFDKSMFLEYYKWTKRPVLGHGDFRPSNLMHRIQKDGSVDIKIVDLQTMQGSSPIVDLLYFIFTGSDEQFRAQYYEKLLDHYYTQLHAAMKRLHLDPEKVYSREDFDHELKEKLPFGLTIALFTLPVITVETENAPQVNEDLDLSAFSVEKTSALYTERLNGVVNDYVRWGVLK